MTYLDLTLPTPEENLAMDEALLDFCEGPGDGEILRFWEPRQTFVVVGYANKIDVEVNVSECRAQGIPILRRCSGKKRTRQRIAAQANGRAGMRKNGNYTVRAIRGERGGF